MRKSARAKFKSRSRQQINNVGIQLKDSASVTSPGGGRWGPSTVTYYFDKEYRCGQFWNGDWWVCPDNPGGTVTVTSIDPPQVAAPTANPSTITGYIDVSTDKDGNPAGRLTVTTYGRTLYVGDVITGTGVTECVVTETNDENPLRTGNGINKNGNYTVSVAQTVSSRSMAINFTSGFWWHGSQLDIEPGNKQAFDSTLKTGGYDPAQQATFPLVISATSGPRSLVKGVSYTDWDFSTSGDGSHRPLKFAAVLTIVNEPMVDSHLKFRPGVCGTPANKNILNSTDIIGSALPSIDVNTVTDPVLKSIIDGFNFNGVRLKFRHLMLDYYTDWTGRYIHPGDVMPAYGSDVSNNISNAIMATCFNSFDMSKLDHKRYLYGILQYAIDLASAIKNGTRWDSNGGHLSGRKLPLLFAEKLFGSNGGTYFREAIQENEKFGASVPSTSITSSSWAAGVATITTSTQLATTRMQTLRIINASNPAYNGFLTVKKVISSTQFEAWLWGEVNPGANLTSGTLQRPRLFQEDEDTYYSWASGSKKALWGTLFGGESDYWSEIATGSGSRTVRDPFGYIDGGSPGYNSVYGWIGGQSNSYQVCCTTNQYKYAATAARLLNLVETWNYPPFFDYVDRVFAEGTVASPDPIAPYDDTHRITVNDTTGIQIGDIICNNTNVVVGTTNVNNTGTVTGIVDGTKLLVVNTRRWSSSTTSTSVSNDNVGWSTSSPTLLVIRGGTITNGQVVGGTQIKTVTYSAIAHNVNKGLTYGTATTTDNGHTIGEPILGAGRVPNNHGLRATRFTGTIVGTTLTITQHSGMPIRKDMYFIGKNLSSSYKINSTNVDNPSYSGTGTTGTYAVNTPGNTNLATPQFFYASDFGYGIGFMDYAYIFQQGLNPRSLNFNSFVEQEASVLCTSEWVKLGAGLTNVSISISGGISSEYSIADDILGTNATAFTSSPGTVSSGKWIRVRALSSSTESTTNTTTLIVDSYVNYFNVRTKVFVPFPKIKFNANPNFTTYNKTITSATWRSTSGGQLVITVSAAATEYSVGQTIWFTSTAGTGNFAAIDTPISGDGVIIAAFENSNTSFVVPWAVDPGAFTVTAGRVFGACISGGVFKVGGGFTSVVLAGMQLNGGGMANGDRAISYRTTGSGTGVNADGAGGVGSYNISGITSNSPTTGYYARYQTLGDFSGFGKHSYCYGVLTNPTSVSITNISVANEIVGTTTNSGAWIVTYTLASAHGLAADEYVFIKNVTGGTGYNTTSGSMTAVHSIVDGNTFTVRRTSDPGTWTSLTSAVVFLPTDLITLSSIDSPSYSSSIPVPCKIGAQGAGSTYFDNARIIERLSGSDGGIGNFRIDKKIAQDVHVEYINIYGDGDKRYGLIAMKYRTDYTLADSESILSDSSGNNRIAEKYIQIGGSGGIRLGLNNQLNPIGTPTTKLLYIDYFQPDRLGLTISGFYDEGTNTVFGVGTHGIYADQTVTFLSGMTGTATVSTINTYERRSFTVTGAPTGYSGPITFKVEYIKSCTIGTDTEESTNGIKRYVNTLTGVNTSGLYKYQTLTKLSGAGAFGGIAWVISVHPETNSVTFGSTSPNTSGSISVKFGFGAFSIWTMQDGIHQKSTSVSSNDTWNVFNHPQTPLRTYISPFLGRMGNMYRETLHPWYGELEFLWINGYNSVDDVPDISDPAIRAMFTASKIGQNGEIRPSEIPSIYFTGTSAEFNTKLRNKGTSVIHVALVPAVHADMDKMYLKYPYGTAVVLTDSSIYIKSGTGAGQTRSILSHSGNVVTLESPWQVKPDTTSEYELRSRLIFKYTKLLPAG